MPRVLVITPTYNERDNLEALVTGVTTALPEARLLVVDDASPDGTGRLADEIAARDERVEVLHRPAKLGLASAYLDGFRHGLASGYERFVQLDADLSHDPRDLPRLMAALDAGADLASGCRHMPGGGVVGWGPGRRLVSRGGSLYARALLGLPARDPTTGYKALRREVLEAIDLDEVCGEGYSFLIEITYRALRRGFRLTEVPIVFVDRRAGASKMSFAIFLEAVWLVPWLRWLGLTGRL